MHVVDFGDTLQGIALKYKLKVSELKRFNRISGNATAVIVGEKLLLEAPPPPPPPPSPAELPATPAELCAEARAHRAAALPELSEDDSLRLAVSEPSPPVKKSTGLFGWDWQRVLRGVNSHLSDTTASADSTSVRPDPASLRGPISSEGNPTLAGRSPDSPPHFDADHAVVRSQPQAAAPSSEPRSPPMQPLRPTMEDPDGWVLPELEPSSSALSSCEHVPSSPAQLPDPDPTPAASSPVQVPTPAPRKRTSSRTPRLDGKSDILTADLRTQLESVLPPAAQGYTWKLLYSSTQHGSSMGTFTDRCRREKRTLIVVETLSGEVFGGFASATWQHHASYFGTGEAFLFAFDLTDREVKLRFYPWAAINSFTQMCTEEFVAMGGGGGDFGLLLEDDFGNGTTGSCDTFLNEPLCPSGQFEIATFEVFGFHTPGESERTHC